MTSELKQARKKDNCDHGSGSNTEWEKQNWITQAKHLLIAYTRDA